MRLIFDLGVASEQVWLEVTREERAHLLKYAKGTFTPLVAQAYTYSKIVNSLELLGDAELSGLLVTRPEDAMTTERVFGIPLKVAQFEVLDAAVKAGTDV